MKKLTFLIAALLVGSMMFTGCKKDPQPTPEPTPEPGPEPTPALTVLYSLGNSFTTDDGVEVTISPCFHFNFTYTGADGNAIEVNNPTLPWSQSISVEAPFTAKIEGSITYEESELPDTVVFGKFVTLIGDGKIIESNSHYIWDKATFIERVENRPNLLKISSTLPIQ